jgi:hypothetical protein
MGTGAMRHKPPWRCEIAATFRFTFELIYALIYSGSREGAGKHEFVGPTIGGNRWAFESRANFDDEYSGNKNDQKRYGYWRKLH